MQYQQSVATVLSCVQGIGIGTLSSKAPRGDRTNAATGRVSPLHVGIPMTIVLHKRTGNTLDTSETNEFLKLFYLT